MDLTPVRVVSECRFAFLESIDELVLLDKTSGEEFFLYPGDLNDQDEEDRLMLERFRDLKALLHYKNRQE